MKSVVVEVFVPSVKPNVNRPIMTSNDLFLLHDRLIMTYVLVHLRAWLLACTTVLLVFATTLRTRLSFLYRYYSYQAGPGLLLKRTFWLGYVPNDPLFRSASTLALYLYRYNLYTGKRTCHVLIQTDLHTYLIKF